MIETLQADPIWEADFKFNFEHVGFGVTLREIIRNNKLTYEPIILKPRGEARAENIPLCIISMEVVMTSWLWVPLFRELLRSDKKAEP